MRSHKARAVTTTGFFICKECKNYIPRRLIANASPAAHYRQQHCINILHIDCAATPNHSIFNDSSKRINAPVLRVCWNNVDMAMDYQSWTGSIRAFNMRDDIASVRSRFINLCSDSNFSERGDDILCDRFLVALSFSVIHRWNPDKILAD